jgi:hypothetical protein
LKKRNKNLFTEKENLKKKKNIEILDCTHGYKIEKSRSIRVSSYQLPDIYDLLLVVVQ